MMLTVDCPWCAEPAMVDATEAAELICEACGVRADLAPDPAGDPVARAA
jgi:uncharacterized protein (DUF983 family)